MSRIAPHLRNLAVVLGLSLVMAGCVVGPAPYGYYGGAYVNVAPPAPRAEYYGVAPYPGYFWIGGFWRWGPRGYVWAPGHWAAPRPGYRYMQRHWVRGPRGWHMAGGRWVRR